MTHMEDDSLKDHAKTISIPTDKEELGSDNADQELTLTLLESDEDILDQVEAAIHRIEDGDYGRCEKCGEEIPKTRLDAIPYAADCVRCASQREQRVLPFPLSAYNDSVGRVAAHLIARPSSEVVG